MHDHVVRVMAVPDGVLPESEEGMMTRISQTTKVAVYRVQDNEGRGPFRPFRQGFPQYWLDDDLGTRSSLPTWGDEFGHDLIRKNYKKRYHYGSAVKTLHEITNWFSPSELIRLYYWQYSVVMLQADRILAESTLQVVFERKKPFHIGVQIIPLSHVVFGIQI